MNYDDFQWTWQRRAPQILDPAIVCALADLAVLRAVRRHAAEAILCASAADRHGCVHAAIKKLHLLHLTKTLQVVELLRVRASGAHLAHLVHLLVHAHLGVVHLLATHHHWRSHAHAHLWVHLGSHTHLGIHLLLAPHHHLRVLAAHHHLLVHHLRLGSLASHHHLRSDTSSHAIHGGNWLEFHWLKVRGVPHSWHLHVGGRATNPSHESILSIEGVLRWLVKHPRERTLHSLGSWQRGESE